MNKFQTFLKKLAPISNAEFDASLSYFSELNLGKGDIFIAEGKICKQIAFILEGTLRVFYLNDKAEETTSCFCTVDNFTTSYKSFVLQQPSTITIHAIEDSKLLVIDYDKLQELYIKYPIWQTIGRVIAEREYIVMEQYASILNNESAKEKYLRLINEQPNVIQTAKIEDIASYLGITRRTLSRIRQDIQK